MDAQHQGMWNNCSQQLHQMSSPAAAASPTKSHEGSSSSSFSSPRVRFPRTLQFLQTSSPHYSYYAEAGSPVYAFPYYPMGNSSWQLYQSPRGIGRRFGLVPATPRSPLRLPTRLDDVVTTGPWRPPVAEAAAVLSPAVARGLNVSSMSTTRGINYGPVAEDLSLKMDRFKVRIVEIGDDDDDLKS